MSKRILTHLSTVDLVMGGIIQAVGRYTLKANLEDTPFVALAQAIAHQQLHATAATTILKRFIENVGGGTFPTPQQVLDAPDAVLRAVGFSTAKSAALKDLAAKTIAGIVPNREELLALEDLAIIERLTQVRGIGRWTVEMMLMFQLGRHDVLPVDDFGVRNGFRLAYGLRKMPSPKVLAMFGERWAPHRSAAAWYLWRAVELHKAGTLPVPVERIRLPRLRKKSSRASASSARLRRSGARTRASRPRAPQSRESARTK